MAGTAGARKRGEVPRQASGTQGRDEVPTTTVGMLMLLTRHAHGPQARNQSMIGIRKEAERNSAAPNGKKAIGAT